MAELLQISDLDTEIRLRDRTVRPVQGVSFSVDAGECLGLVGESGCGKTMTARSIMRLLPANGKVVSGSVRLLGRDLAPLSEKQMQRVRGNEVALIPQDPMTSLNPTMNIGRQIAEGVRLHREVNKGEARARSLEVLELVDMPRPAERLDQYPHELSGGLRQRVMIAMALACNPKLLIADEPTTALDVTIQAQILDLMADLKKRVGAAIILITHDLGVVAEIAERVVVMYAGRKVEEAKVADLFRAPRHPYTQGLLAAVPKLGSSLTDGETKLAEIPGVVPSLKQRIAGCVFASRCAFTRDICRHVAPPLEQKAAGHFAACHFAPGEMVAA